MQYFKIRCVLQFNLFECATDCHDVRCNQVKCVAAIRIFVFVLYMQEDSNMNNRNSAFYMQFAYKLCSSPEALLSAARH